MQPTSVLLVASMIMASSSCKSCQPSSPPKETAIHIPHVRPAMDGGALTAQQIRLIIDRFEVDGGLTVEEALERFGEEERQSDATRKLIGR